MATKGSVSNLAVLALICFRMDLVTSQSCDKSNCTSIDNCINANTDMLKFAVIVNTTLSATAYNYLKTNTSKDSDLLSSLSSYYLTFSAFSAKFRAFTLTPDYTVYTYSTSQRNNATSYNNALNRVLGEIDASLKTIPTIPPAVASDQTVIQMTDLYAETYFVSTQFKEFLLSWESCSNCQDRERMSSKVPKKSVIGRGKKEKKITTKKPNKVTKARKRKGKNKGIGNGEQNKKQ